MLTTLHIGQVPVHAVAKRTCARSIVFGSKTAERTSLEDDRQFSCVRRLQCTAISKPHELDNVVSLASTGTRQCLLQLARIAAGRSDMF